MPGPFTKNSSVYFTTAGNTSTLKQTLAQTWWTSPRSVGSRQLALAPQQFSRTLKHNMSYYQKTTPQGHFVTPPSLGVVTSNEPEIVKARDDLYNQCYARLWNRIKGDTASLGVSITQWKDSWRMIKLANDRIFSYAHDAALEAVRRNRNGKRLKKERASDVFLEYQFGWAPLLGDIVSAAKAMVQCDPSGWYSGRGNSTVTLPDGTMTSTRKETGRVAIVRRCLSAKAEVSNPNLWLLNQLGLVNPAVIAWDKIPWSFVVNEFVNVNQILNSFSNDWGLHLSQISDTTTTQLFDNVWMSNGYPPSHPFYVYGSSSAMQKFKSRALLATLPRPDINVHLPRVSMTKGLIASSLATQQIRRLRS